MLPSPAESFWALVGAVLAAVGMLATGLHRILAWPVLWAFEHVLYLTLLRTPARHRALVDALYAAEIAERQRIATVADSTQREVTALRAAIELQARSLEALPSMDRSVEKLSTTLASLDRTLQTLVDDVKTHGEDLAHVRGRIDEWDGRERRTATERRTSRRTAP